LNTLLAIDLSSLVSKGFVERAVEVASSLLLSAVCGLDSSATKSSMHATSPVQASAFQIMSLPAISGLVSTFSGSLSVIASSASTSPPEVMSVPFGCSPGVGQNVGVAVKVDSDYEGFSPTLDFSEVGSDSFSVSYLGAATLGERLCFLFR